MAGLGCDFFIAGCHKCLFGPRGTGLVWGSARGWQRVLPAIPSFLDNGAWDAWFAGIVCFEVGGMSPYDTVIRLRERGVIATVTSYAARYVRLAPSIRKSPAEVDAVLREIRALA